LFRSFFLFRLLSNNIYTNIYSYKQEHKRICLSLSSLLRKSCNSFVSFSLSLSFLFFVLFCDENSFYTLNNYSNCMCMQRKTDRSKRQQLKIFPFFLSSLFYIYMFIYHCLLFFYFMQKRKQKHTHIQQEKLIFLLLDDFNILKNRTVENLVEISLVLVQSIVCLFCF